MLRRTILTLAAGFLAIPNLAPAEPVEWRFDAAHSYVGFKVRHMMVSWVRGRFNEAQGKIWYDPANPAATRVEIDINPATIDTENERRDKHLRSDDFFAVDKHPAMKFVSKKAEPSGGGLKVTGDLTMRGVTKEIVLTVADISPTVADGRGGEKMGATASAKINRKEWGINYHQVLDSGGLNVGDEVTIEIEAELARGGGERKTSGD
jgi:polyisoprenoid-binding protein YceI